MKYYGKSLNITPTAPSFTTTLPLPLPRGWPHGRRREDCFNKDQTPHTLSLSLRPVPILSLFRFLGDHIFPRLLGDVDIHHLLLAFVERRVRERALLQCEEILGLAGEVDTPRLPALPHVVDGVCELNSQALPLKVKPKIPKVFEGSMGSTVWGVQYGVQYGGEREGELHASSIYGVVYGTIHTYAHTHTHTRAHAHTHIHIQHATHRYTTRNTPTL